MTSSHALGVAAVPRKHWLFSDLWLPNGWATVAFVVLSGYGVGYLFSTREQAERDAALINRCMRILAVMFISNFIFCALDQVFHTHQAFSLLNLKWWIGFFTLDTDWTISGILLPTALTLLGGPFLIRACQRATWITLAVLIVFRITVTLLRPLLADTVYAEGWILKFLLFKGFGFPVLIFVLNGFLGIWLGIFHRCCAGKAWSHALVVLMFLQVLLYFSSFNQTPSLLISIVSSFGALAKFAWVFAVALLLTRIHFFPIVSMIGIIGKYSLGSFIAHRVFLQAIDISWTHFFRNLLFPGYYYCVLVISTLVLTWTLCVLRDRYPAVNRCFKRLAL